ncbi:MAG: 3-phosphoshikimate 1-carboxyvinyltransferase [Clostridiaceae bacterium]|jgi:3-phosphoshikimate 1-carboxyvinyltransferase|nr:3-phosphoshikimate 1-carboxyvinyltransferase [Clostridiaceae bacterium]
MNISLTINNPTGEINAIASKSYAHRHLICSALSDKPNYLKINQSSQDIEATINCLNALGATIVKNDNGIAISPISKIIKNACLDCNESGSTFRFMLPISCALNSESVFQMKPGLARRPITNLYLQLKSKGCILSEEGSVPFYANGQLQGGDFSLPGNISSQFITGLLMALPLLNLKSTITLTSDLESSGYVDITIDVLKNYGVNIEKKFNKFIIPENQKYISPGNADIEKDWSNAAFFLCAGALTDKGITVTGLNRNSHQKDMYILNVLKDIGADISFSENKITVKKNKLNSFELDAKEIPDIIPVLSLVASLSKGTSRIYNAKRLRIKESDRLSSIYDMLKKIGAQIEQDDDTLLITGKPMLKGGIVDSFNDHRIAMTAAIASISCENPVIIKDAQAINKSYPSFLDDFIKIGGKVETVSGGNDVFSIR